jgi:hypothetical protein
MDGRNSGGILNRGFTDMRHSHLPT